MRILVVDDEPNILELLKAFLEAADNHEVVTATSGADALVIIDKADVDFDCLLLDIQMPEMNGIALCENVRALPDYMHVPVIMLTAMSQKTYIDKAFSVGATDYVTKPFDFLELRGRLKAAAKIVQEHNRATDSAEAARRLAMDHGTEVKPHPDEPLIIDGVERVVGYAAFENFVLTLSRTKLLFASAFAVQIADFRTLHATVSAREMRTILKTVAQVIAEHIPDAGNLVSYRGNGVFLCINQRKTLIAANQRETQINGALAVCKATKTGNIEVKVTVGQEISLVSISRAGALMALRKAVDSIEHRPIPMKDVATLSKRVLRNQSRSQEQSNLERRAYELVLEDIVREENAVPAKQPRLQPSVPAAGLRP
jgi:DNA-binding response OmpR family regulator